MDFFECFCLEFEKLCHLQPTLIFLPAASCQGLLAFQISALQPCCQWLQVAAKLQVNCSCNLCCGSFRFIGIFNASLTATLIAGACGKKQKKRGTKGTPERIFSITFACGGNSLAGVVWLQQFVAWPWSCRATCTRNSNQIALAFSRREPKSAVQKWSVGEVSVR